MNNTTHHNIPLWRQFIRYSVSGTIATATDKALFYVMHYTLDINVYVATTVAFITGLAITYIFSITWIFQQRRMAGTIAEPFIYLIIGLGGVLLMNVLMWLFMRVMPDTETIMLLPRNFFCNITATLLVTIYNFIAKRLILFTTHE
jgi:putative flippase GtrA